MSPKARHTYLFYFIALAIAGVTTVILRTVALFTMLEPQIGFYSSPTLSIATAAILIATAVILAIFTHELRQLFVFTTDYRDLPTQISGAFLAIALCFFAVLTVTAALSMATVTLVTALLTAACALGGIPVLLIHVFDGSAHGAKKAMPTLALAFLGVLYAAYLGFEGTMMIASPAKLLATAAWVLAAFFFLGETRIALERPRYALHTCVTALTALFFATLSVPNLLYHAVNGLSPIGSTAHDFLALGIFLYSLARLFAVFASADRENTPEIRYVTDHSVTAEAEATKEERREETTDR